VKVFVGDVIARGKLGNPTELTEARLVIEDQSHGVVATPLLSDMWYTFLPAEHLRTDLDDGGESNRFVIRDPFDLRE
jgi:hypothetical protein